MPNYGYPPAPKRDPRTYRVIVCESELRRYMEAFPALSREEILSEMIAARPDRARLEERLAQIARRAAKAN